VSSPLLGIAHETIGDAIVVHVSGEIDMITAPEVQEHLEKACARANPPQIVVADLTGVRFIGSSGLSVLLEVDKRCRGQHTPLRVVVTTPATVHPLQVTGLDRVLGVVGSLDSVIRSA
jgi:anti-sigma B factor antagonist